MKLIADSGSTKTDWLLGGQAIETVGINPVRDSGQSIEKVIYSLPDEDVGQVFFYGAGCISPYKETVECILQRKYPDAQVCVESDMLGAARALCGHDEGVVCILGTGSNSCLYDGESITLNTPPLGYILGDEGSGASLGRILVGDMLKGQLGNGLRDKFLSHFHLMPEDITYKVYRQPAPNRFLASLVPFIADCKECDAMHRMLVNEFRRFLTRNVAQYCRPDLPVHFSGGVAHSFESELREAASQEGFHVGTVVKSPMEGIERYHHSAAIA